MLVLYKGFGRNETRLLYKVFWRVHQAEFQRPTNWFYIANLCVNQQVLVRPGAKCLRLLKTLGSVQRGTCGVSVHKGPLGPHHSPTHSLHCWETAITMGRASAQTLSQATAQKATDTSTLAILCCRRCRRALLRARVPFGPSSSDGLCQIPTALLGGGRTVTPPRPAHTGRRGVTRAEARRGMTRTEAPLDTTCSSKTRPLRGVPAGLGAAAGGFGICASRLVLADEQRSR
mmetsp:Transcript_79588/g.140458  ORF Transcript_79588/g.140458 Transcript_79588/m.140458 type:complete len:231 (+) Transcript_79588:571-1263(+)